MEQYLEFAGNHLVLVSAFVVVLGALIWNLLGSTGGKNNIEPGAATRMINHDDALVLDVRSMAEFKSEGHIINAENIPLNGLGNALKKLEKHKTKPIIAVCKTGSRSAAACAQLRKAGFE